METTVTMSLSEFEKLADCYEQMERLRENSDFVCCFRSYGNYATRKESKHAQLILDLEYVVIWKDQLLDKIKKYEQKTGKTIE
jgi:hypothetical protein